jgi:hypothetical protein
MRLTRRLRARRRSLRRPKVSKNSFRHRLRGAANSRMTRSRSSQGSRSGKTLGGRLQALARAQDQVPSTVCRCGTSSARSWHHSGHDGASMARLLWWAQRLRAKASTGAARASNKCGKIWSPLQTGGACACESARRTIARVRRSAEVLLDSGIPSSKNARNALLMP